MYSLLSYISFNYCKNRQMQLGLLTFFNIPQQMMDTTPMKTLLVRPKTIINFLNINIASAPIQNTAARVKYCIRKEIVVHAYSFCVCSIPALNVSNIKKRAIQSCAWNLLASLWRSFLLKTIFQLIFCNTITYLKNSIVNTVSRSPTIDNTDPIMVKNLRAFSSLGLIIGALIFYIK